MVRAGIGLRRLFPPRPTFRPSHNPNPTRSTCQPSAPEPHTQTFERRSQPGKSVRDRPFSRRSTGKPLSVVSYRSRERSGRTHRSRHARTTASRFGRRGNRRAVPPPRSSTQHADYRRKREGKRARAEPDQDRSATIPPDPARPRAPDRNGTAQDIGGHRESIARIWMRSRHRPTPS